MPSKNDDIEAVALREMATLISVKVGTGRWSPCKLLEAFMYSVKQSVKDETTWHVFIQEFAAALNRQKILSNTNEQPFREWAYRYIHGQ